MSGTNSTDKNNLSSREVCEILKACAEVGVSVLKFGDLHVTFGRHAEPKESNQIPIRHNLESKPNQENSDKEISDDQHKKLQEEYLEVEQLRTRDEQIAELLITNPLAAEEMIRNEELEDVDTEPSDIE